MSSASNSRNTPFHAASVLAAVLLSIVLVLAVGGGQVDAKKGNAAAVKAKLPSITAVAPLNAFIGATLTISGKNFVKGKNANVFIFQRKGSKRKFTVRGKGLSTKTATVVVPNVAGDLITPKKDQVLLPGDNQYRIRTVTKYGASKGITPPALSPVFSVDPNSPVNVANGADGDCDNDGILNGKDPDDDNDLLTDVEETAAGTNVCSSDTDGDGVSDYYEYRVAYERNGGPTLPYPGRRPYPNPLVGGDENTDYDGDQMSQLREFQAWQYTGHMDRFYSDANQDSDGDGTLDGAEDEDNDLLPNMIEIATFTGWSLGSKLEFLTTDTDGDGLCDGLDDEDHDGPPTSLAVADCSTPVPNNGNVSLPNSHAGSGDPDPTKIDGDDNIYSNFYEWSEYKTHDYFYQPCFPSQYPTSPFCGQPIAYP